VFSLPCPILVGLSHLGNFSKFFSIKPRRAGRLVRLAQRAGFQGRERRAMPAQYDGLACAQSIAIPGAITGGAMAGAGWDDQLASPCLAADPVSVGKVSEKRPFVGRGPLSDLNCNSPLQPLTACRLLATG
jgi:hypothetical protein